jgi:hypothetical protein
MPCQNQAQLRDLSESMERIRKEKFFKLRIIFNPNDLKEKENISKLHNIEDDDESDIK